MKRQLGNLALVVWAFLLLWSTFFMAASLLGLQDSYWPQMLRHWNDWLQYPFALAIFATTLAIMVNTKGEIR